MRFFSKTGDALLNDVRPEKQETITVDFAHCGICGKSVSGDYSRALSFKRNHEIMCRPHVVTIDNLTRLQRRWGPSTFKGGLMQDDVLTGTWMGLTRAINPVIKAIR